jgi:[ribosomal protein S5]-alanine N-acetyltransferase
VFELQRLRSDHEAAVLAFEQENWAYFVQSISDRGNDFFEKFAEHYRALVAEQDIGGSAFYLLVDQDTAVVGRFNLYDLVDGGAEVGYRVAQRVAGRNVATSGLRELCRIANAEFGLRTLRAAVSHENVASQRVLLKAGFVATEPTEVGGKQGRRYELRLASAGHGPR